jgi:hypothetical protein
LIRFQLALPKCNHLPSQHIQLNFGIAVAFLGVFDFAEPPFGACFGNHKIFAAFVSVPETTVNKNDGFVFGQNNVGFSGQVFYIQPVPESVGKQKPPHQYFRLCVFALNAAHVKGAGCFVVHIGHGSFEFRVQGSKLGKVPVQSSMFKVAKGWHP